VEDTGLPRLLRDAQVLPIWEGTTNVLSLDVLRAVQRGASVEALAREIHRACGDASGPAAAAARGGVAHALAWLTDTLERRGPAGVEAGARRLALTLGRCLEVALLVEHGRWLEAQGESGRGADAAARRLVRHGVDYLVDDDEDGDAAAILGG
jgi:hypothetical protein